MTKVKIEGFRELDRALSNLPKATGRNVLKRTLMKAAKPVDDEASSNAPEDTGRLERSVIIGTRLTKSQRKGGPKLTASGYRSEAKNYVEVRVGTAMSRGLFTEFGTYKDPPQFWFTKAWDATHTQAFDIIKAELSVEIDKAAQRYAKKQAKLGA